jgi:hypothetical protein
MKVGTIPLTPGSSGHRRTQRYWVGGVVSISRREYVYVNDYTAADRPPTDPRPTKDFCLTCDHPTIHTAHGIDGPI